MDELRERIEGVIVRDGSVLQWVYDYDLMDNVDVSELIGNILSEIAKTHVLVEQEALLSLVGDAGMNAYERGTTTEGEAFDAFYDRIYRRELTVIAAVDVP